MNYQDNFATKKHMWTEEELEIVRSRYRGTQSAKRLAQELGVTFFAVKGQASKLGLLPDKSPPWTEKELDTLRKFVHIKTIDQLTKILHRSSNAVKIKATRLKLDLRKRDDWFTKTEAGEILGVGHKVVQKWIDCGALEASYHNGTRPSKHGMAMWHITAVAMRDFIIRCSGELVGRNVDVQQLVWILTDYEKE